MTQRPRIAISMGDPAGIGPEIAAKALNDPAIRALADFVVFGDRRLWRKPGGGTLAEFESGTISADAFMAEAGEAARRAGATAPPLAAVPRGKSTVADSAATVAPGKCGAGVAVVEFPGIDYAAIPVGQISAAAGEASIRYVLAAVEAIQQGRLDALVTGPIHKEAIHAAGYAWPGHTELLAEKFAAPEVAMMFAGGPFRVVLATIHMSMADVLRTLSSEGILRTLRLADRALKDYFGIALPRLGVCGLNPHAGEGGRFGFEEREIIGPALALAREEGIAAFGPLPADTIFRTAMQGKFDIVVAMYHDQGLIPIKTMAFEQSVNITLGIPAIRTSVDHGTAFDIAGRGLADPSSMKSAIRMAVEMCQARHGTRE